MMNRVVLMLIALSVMTEAHAQFKPLSPGDYAKAYDARRDSVIRFYANQVPADDLTRGHYNQIAARAWLGQDQAWQLSRLDTLMKNVTGDMFWMYPFTLLMYNGMDQYPAEVQVRMRDLWRTYRPYRGDTENHWVLYYATLYLAAERWPNDAGDRWFNGKSSKENRDEAREFLDHWIHLTTTVGQGEYDSPHYLKVYLAPMALLYAYAQDPEMRLRAEMMLDYLIADFAVESLGGLNGAATARAYEREAVEPFNTSAADFAWLFWGNVPGKMWGEAMILAMSGYRPPYILYLIANDRDQAYAHRELKRTRHRIRHSLEKNVPVYKTTYMTKDYVLGSSQGGLLQPIQQMTWKLIWKVDNPKGIANTLFTVQPYAEPIEGTMYFAEPTDLVNEFIVRSKTEYNKANKWTGGSPYEQVHQEDDALIALYDVPAGIDYGLVSGFFSLNLDDLREDPSGWIFATAGSTYIGVYPIMKYDWIDDDPRARRLSAKAGKAGFVVQVAQASEFENVEAFKERVRTLPLQHQLLPKPSVSFTSLRGKKMVMNYGEVPVVNGVAVDYDAWPLYESIYIEGAKNSGKMLIKYGNMRHALDFTTNTKRTWLEE